VDISKYLGTKTAFWCKTDANILRFIQHGQGLGYRVCYNEFAVERGEVCFSMDESFVPKQIEFGNKSYYEDIKYDIIEYNSD
jgi:hypothetical protein